MATTDSNELRALAAELLEKADELDAPPQRRIQGKFAYALERFDDTGRAINFVVSLPGTSGYIASIPGAWGEEISYQAAQKVVDAIDRYVAVTS
jgi:hypothetical protein